MPNPKPEERCKNCKYFVVTGYKPECRRFPPAVFYDSTKPINPATGFPETDHDLWCGEYKEKSK